MLSISIMIIVLLLLLLSLSLSVLWLIVESSKLYALGAWQTKKEGLQRSPLIDKSPCCPGITEFQDCVAGIERRVSFAFSPPLPALFVSARQPTSSNT